MACAGEFAEAWPYRRLLTASRLNRTFVMRTFLTRSRQLAAALCCALIPLAVAPLAAAAPNLSLQGRVVAALPQQAAPTFSIARSVFANAPQPTLLGRPILLPNIQVSLRNATTKGTTPPVTTNPQGYFAIHNLDEGRYQVCVSATGFASQCEDRIVSVSRPAQILDHLVRIAPEANALVGAVHLADGTTPCFWYRPSFNPQPLVAKVSLLDATSKVVAGPVSGNALGQYVLPVASGVQSATLHVECDAASASSRVATISGAVLRDVSLGNRAPSIQALDFTKGGAGIRAANVGDTIRVAVLASDPDGDTLHYAWVDDSGRNLGLPDAASVNWPLLNSTTLNTIHVQVTDGKGGFATLSRSIPVGNSSIFFDGRLFDRRTGAGIAAATVSVNHTSAKSDSAGLFHVSVPDAPQFVLNANKPGYALTSLILRSRANGIAVPMDAAQTATLNAGAGGTVQIAGGGCNCLCSTGRSGGKSKSGHDHDRHADHDKDRDRDRDEDHDRDRDDDHDGKGGSGGANCSRGNATPAASVTFPAGVLASSSGARVSGTVSVEGFQYDLSQPNPIPGDFGAIYQGKGVRLGSFGALHIQVRDAQGRALAMAPGKKATISIPIQAAQLAVAPTVIPLFHYDETQGLWVEDGTLTRTGTRYVGQIAHFSAFNADTVFPGGACVKVLLDNSFVTPVSLSATYFDPSVGSFNHNGSVTSDTTIGVERMAPNQNFTLTITDSQPTTVSVVLNSGPGLDTTLFPGGLDTDQVNFSHCNGPVQISNNLVPGAAQQPAFLEFAGVGSATSAANYQAATGAQTGGPKATLNQWKQVNGFNTNGTLASGEATAIYFNNGDLKFGRDMHCRVNSSNVLACYVSNFGTVGTDDAVSAIADANAYEASGQTSPAPVATVTMEYDQSQGANAVQFWAYKFDGSYLAQPALDNQGGKFIPEICLACHQGTYSQAAGAVVSGAKFLFFDLDSFKDGSGNFLNAGSVSAAVQTQFHTLNNMIASASPTAAMTTLINQVWYSNTTASTPFNFGTGAAQLPGQPFVASGVNHNPLYDNVVKIDCRTCHVASSIPWDSYSLMNSFGSTIQSLACGPGAPEMPNAQVPWLNFWANNRGATLVSELSLNQPTYPGCPAP
jgi:hypothetical protein